MQIIDEKYNWNGGFTSRFKTDYIVLHHAEAVKCTAQDVHSWHRANGWTGIGYHFFVRKDGTIYSGRPINVVGAHEQGISYKRKDNATSTKEIYYRVMSISKKELLSKCEDSWT